MLMLFLLSCSHRTGMLQKGPELPPWVQDVEKFCPKGHLCAVGTGPSLTHASLAASAGIAQIFEQTVKAKFKSSLVSDNRDEAEFVSEDIEATTELALQGIHHPRSFQDRNGSFYSLAGINKSRAANNFARQMDKIDQKIKGLLKNQKTGTFFLIEKKLKERELLSKYHSLLSNLKRPSPLAWPLFLQKREQAIKGMVVHLQCQEEKPLVICPFLGNMLASLGMKLTQGENLSPKATHILSVKFAFVEFADKSCRI